jgi:hypothetical protein
MQRKSSKLIRALVEGLTPAKRVMQQKQVI